MNKSQRMNWKQRLTIGAASLSILAAGCASTEKRPASELESRPLAQSPCAAWFDGLDAAVDRAGVRDAGAHRIAGFPYLRVDRFNASLRDEARNNSPAFDTWLARLEILDTEARDAELSNLPAESFPIAGQDRDAARERTRACAAELAREDFAGTTQRDMLIARAQVPDSYSDWKREVGLYPIASIPFAQGVEAWHREASGMFRKSAMETHPAAAVARYQPATRNLHANEVTAIVSNADRDALGIPRYTVAERELLLRAYAPAYEIESTGEFDRFGPLGWRNGPAPEVDTARPLAYRRLEFTRFHGRILTQLIYTIWFPERPGSSAVDLLAGRLDGVVFRVTLDSDGAPFVYDTMHPCGCYHMFFPTANAEPLPAAEASIEWAYAPLTLPVLAPGQRVVVRIQSRTHYVVDVRPDNGAAGDTYRVADENDLRALPALSGGTRSAFGPDGIVPGTERGERYIFWPMGIDDAGAMRQWGNHATAFIGKRHFDDADLIERRFSRRQAGQLVSAGTE